MKPAPALVCAMLLAAACRPENELSHENNAGPITRTENIYLTIAADGSVYWNTIAVDQAELRRRLALESQRRPKTEVRIKPDPEVKYADVAVVISAVGEAGLRQEIGVAAGKQPTQH